MKIDLTEDFTLTIGVDFWSAVYLLFIGVALIGFHHTIKRF
ncbi:MAG: hypothetical protein ACRBFS_21635 [Aureispira sp.]